MITEPNTPMMWVSRVAPDTKVVYHVGDLSLAHARSGVRRRAGEWRELSESGFVALTQRRLGDARYEYIATRTTAPMTAPKQLRDIVADGRRIVEQRSLPPGAEKAGARLSAERASEPKTLKIGKIFGG